MRYTRIYAAPDGETHAEDVEPQDKEGEDGATILMNSAASEMLIVQFTPTYQQEWHCSPVPSMCVVLSGEALFMASDGETRRFGPGAVIVTEDIIGKGHVTGAGEHGLVLQVTRLAP